LSSLKLRTINGKYNKQATVRYKLIVSETAWLLWKCINKRVICQKKTPALPNKRKMGGQNE